MKRQGTTAVAAALALLPLGAYPAGAEPGTRPTAEAFHEEAPIWTLRVDQFEHRWTDGKDGVAWQAQGYVGGDVDKVRLKTEGAAARGKGVEEAEIQLLYSRMVGDFWDVQAGVRHDVRPRPQTTYAVFGMQGLAPYFFEVDAQAFLSEQADLSARVEAEFDLLITQKLILQSGAELGLSAQTVEALHTGAGLTGLKLGLRLRYEIVREFAPYVGLLWERKLGRTADFARNEGEDPDAIAFVAGLRFWF